jgi:hypothetical protein
MNLHENILIVYSIDGLKSTLVNKGLPLKEVSSFENDEYLIVHMKHEDKIRNLVGDFGLGSYLRSWSDRYTERVYLKGPTIGMGILSFNNKKSYDLTDGINYWKFSKGDL